MRSLPVQGAWIEIDITRADYFDSLPSLPVQGAWIEISKWRKNSFHRRVAPRAGSVD